MKQKTVQKIPTDYQTAIDKCQQYINKLPKKKTLEQVASTSLSAKRKAEENALSVDIDTEYVNKTVSKEKLCCDNIVKVVETNLYVGVPEQNSKSFSEALSSPSRDNADVGEKKLLLVTLVSCHFNS